MPDVVVEREITLTIPVVVKYEYEYDDDGCGPPSKTGNSMTGRRGKYPVATGAMPNITNDELVKKVYEALIDDMDAALESWVGRV